MASANNHQKGSYTDFLNRKNGTDISNKKFLFRLVKQNAASSIIDSYNRPQVFPGSYTIPNVAVINERDKDGNMTQVTIRYIPGETSIYKHLQSNDKDVPKKNIKYSIKFVNGRKTVLGSDIFLLEFMMKCNQNITNPDRKKDVHAVFELVDTSIAVSKEIAKDKLISEVTNWCWNGDLNEVKAYARVLNVDLNQQNDEIRHDLKVIAMRDPEKFFKELKNPAMRKKHYVLEAIDRGFLILDAASNSIAWATNTAAPIAVAAIGTSPIDVLVNKLGTDEGQLLYRTIVDLLTPDPVVLTKLSIPSEEELSQLKKSKVVVKEPDPLVSESDAELMDIVTSAFEKGIITFTKPMWYKYKDESFKHKDGVVAELKKNPAMLKSLKYEINKANTVTA